MNLGKLINMILCFNTPKVCYNNMGTNIYFGFPRNAEGKNIDPAQNFTMKKKGTTRCKKHEHSLRKRILDNSALTF